MSGWKLVEAIPIAQNQAYALNQNNGSNSGSSNQTRDNRGNRSRYGNNGGGGNNNGNRRNYNNNNNNNTNYNNRNNRRNNRNGIFIPDTPESRSVAAQTAVQFIEYYFSDDCLCSSGVIRSYFDEDGYIPVAYVLNFPDIVAIGAPYEDIVALLSKHSMFEIDFDNETIRRTDWKKWLMPNTAGGFGVPRYIKQPNLQSNNPYELSNTDNNYKNTSYAGELSPTASEFVYSPK